MYLHILSILTHTPTTRIHTLSPADYRGVCAGSCDPSHEPVLAPKVLQVCELPHWTSRCRLCEEPGKVCHHSVSAVSYPSSASFQDCLASLQLGSFPDCAPNPFQLGSFPTRVSWSWVSIETENTISWSHEHTDLIVPMKGRGRLILSLPSHDPGQS